MRLLCTMLEWLTWKNLEEWLTCVILLYVILNGELVQFCSVHRYFWGQFHEFDNNFKNANLHNNFITM